MTEENRASVLRVDVLKLEMRVKDEVSWAN